MLGFDQSKSIDWMAEGILLKCHMWLVDGAMLIQIFFLKGIGSLQIQKRPSSHTSVSTAPLNPTSTEAGYCRISRK